eukprot:309831-Chlamydomonas_euryale.AAC.5
MSVAQQHAGAMVSDSWYALICCITFCDDASDILGQKTGLTTRATLKRNALRSPSLSTYTFKLLCVALPTADTARSLFPAGARCDYLQHEVHSTRHCNGPVSQRAV